MAKYIFCILGSSACGKDTILSKLLATSFDGIYLNKLIPLTSRPPRDGEVNGVDYTFLTKEYFEKLIREKESGEKPSRLMEYRSYNIKTIDNQPDVWYYGNELPDPLISFSILIGTLESYTNMIADPDIELQGYRIIPILISVPKEERLYRMISREARNEKPNYREVARRFLSDEDDLEKNKGVLATIPDENIFTNLVLNETVEAVSSLILKNILEALNE